MGYDIQLKTVLKREMKARNESLNELARKTKIPLSTLHGWGQGTLPNARNLHFLKTLADHFGISLATLLFNVTEENSGSKILFSSSFVDDERRYRLLIEKLPK